MKKRVVIVEEGKLGSQVYASWIKILKKAIKLNEKGEAEVVKSVEEVLKKIEQGYVDTLVFVSGSMFEEAKKIQDKYPLLDIVLLFGQMPRKKPILVSKGWGLSYEAIQKIVLGNI